MPSELLALHYINLFLTNLNFFSRFFHQNLLGMTVDSSLGFLQQKLVHLHDVKHFWMSAFMSLISLKANIDVQGSATTLAKENMPKAPSKLHLLPLELKAVLVGALDRNFRNSRRTNHAPNRGYHFVSPSPPFSPRGIFLWHRKTVGSPTISTGSRV